MDQYSELDLTQDLTMKITSREPLLDTNRVENISYYDVINPESDNYISRYVKYECCGGEEILDEMTDDDAMMFNAIARYSNTPTNHFKQHNTDVQVRRFSDKEMMHSKNISHIPSIDPRTGRANSQITYNPTARPV